MSRSSIFQETLISTGFADTTAGGDTQWVKALLLLGAHLSATPASGLNSTADFVSALIAAGLPTSTVDRVKQVLGTKNYTPHV